MVKKLTAVSSGLSLCYHLFLAVLIFGSLSVFVWGVRYASLLGFLQCGEEGPELAVSECDRAADAGGLELPAALSRLLILPSEGLISKGAGFVLRAFCCVPLLVISFSTEKAFSTRGGKKKKKPKNNPTHFLAVGCFSKRLIKRWL